MTINRTHWLLALTGGVWLALFVLPTVAETSSNPLQLAQGEPLPPLPLGNQGTPLAPNDWPTVTIPESTPLQVNPNFTGDRIPEPSKLYLVYIPGQNQQTLDRVRLYEPEAFFTDYKGRTVIQAGIFADRYNAERLAREMEFGGVRSAIATVTQANTTPVNAPVASVFTTPPPSPENLPPVNTFVPTPPIGTSFTTPPAPLPPGNDVNLPNGYFVVIPSNPQELPRTIQEAIDAGISPTDIFTREEPFGLHVAIGPFSDRTTAEQEQGYLRKFGLDTRIHFTP